MAQREQQVIGGSLESEVAALQEALDRHRVEDAAKERQLDRYAAELRATSRRERHRARELDDSYMATVRALSNAVPDAILFKPGRLDATELEIMRRHPVIGEEIIAGIAFLGPATEVVRHHHERWDGSGYPDGLAGEEIPLAARVFALADALDALTSDRPYRDAVTIAQARRILHQSPGHFDPAVLDAFEQISDARLEEIRRQSADEAI